MLGKSSFTLLATAVALTSACILPTTPLSNTITSPFRVQVQNVTRPDVHNKYMNLLLAGGGDYHLFIGPVGTPTFDLTLDTGAIRQNNIRAVIGGEFSEIDHTTKMFTTERGDPRAIFAPTWACNPDTDAVQIELRFVGWQNHDAGGWICVRPTFDDAHEFRYYPPGNTLSDPSRFCVKVTLVVIPQGGTTFSTSVASSTSSSTRTSSSSSSSTSVSTSTSSRTSTSTSVSTTASSTSSSTSSTGTSSPLPYTDMRAKGFAFIGCAPEDRTANDGGNFRTLSGALYADDLLTNEKCIDFCVGRGFAYAGTEYRRECWCGNSLATTRQPKTTIASLAGCSQTCSGNTAQKCGGSSWLSVYKACPVGGACVNTVFT